jgi:hypothetical protein
MLILLVSSCLSGTVQVHSKIFGEYTKAFLMSYNVQEWIIMQELSVDGVPTDGNC